MVSELESLKTRISAPAHLSATGVGRVSGLVFSRTNTCFQIEASSGKRSRRATKQSNRHLTPFTAADSAAKSGIATAFIQDLSRG